MIKFPEEFVEYPKFRDEQFYRNFESEMELMGFRIAFRFITNTNRYEYHVSRMKHSRKVNYLFYLPGFAWVLHISSHEKHYGESDNTRVYWSIKTDFDIQPVSYNSQSANNFTFNAEGEIQLSLQMEDILNLVSMWKDMLLPFLVMGRLKEINPMMYDDTYVFRSSLYDYERQIVDRADWSELAHSVSQYRRILQEIK